MLLTSSYVRADEINLGFPLKEGAAAPSDLVCFDSTGQYALAGALERGEKAEGFAKTCTDKMSRLVSQSEPKTFLNPWFVFTLGLVVGLGGAVAAGFSF